MCWMKFRTFLLIAGFFGASLIRLTPSDEETSISGGELVDFYDPVILWWTPFGSDGASRTCGKFKCIFTQDRVYWNHQNLKAILFYGSNLEIHDLPVPRGSGIKWGLLHEESPRNNLMFVHQETLRLFNYSSTFSRFSDVPLTLVDLPGEEDLLSKKYFIPTKEKNRLMNEENLSPLLYLQSNCDTLSERDLYISELMKYIAVDAYGACLNNRKLPGPLRDNYIGRLNSGELKKFVGKYKFTLAFENAVCEDYITEKLWRPLTVGSVPIYYGSPSFKDWLPNNSSAVAVQDFKSPKDLAEFLHQLMKNDTLYEQYLSHKLIHEIRNDRLLENLRKRPKGLFSVFEYYLRNFECQVCEKIHRNESRTVSKEEYNCEKPSEKFNYNRKIVKNSWIDVWNIEKCGGKLLTEYLLKNQSVKSTEFNAKKMEMHKENKC
ncbi:alpha-(1,3)-fucosyltransferase 10 isoform X2 [Fopius arisanus]|uniref:Fucosyltransferase n=1 Tax=Fopius arisanus TaxID=64838 RepID=A0A9R1T310_9HYME|nr:PREDICTED: alpha-(1,3)-fucosyltransferase 10 isoform X2 [Fopius arisanus]